MAAYQMPFRNITIVPKVDLTDYRYRFVMVGSDEKGIKASAKGASIGVLQEPNNIDQPASVMVSGVSFVYLDAAVTAGQEVEVGAGGGATPITDGKSLGICLVGGVKDGLGCILLNR